MNFSGLSNKSRFGKMLRFPLRLIPRNAILPVMQGKLRGYKWVAGSSSHGCWLGSYEYEMQQLISSVVKPGTVACDIGAHVGFYTLLFSKLVGPEGRVFAFEPFPRNFEFLRTHISINHISNVELLEMAVSSKTGVTHFSPGATSSTGRIAEDGKLEIQQTSIDDLMDQGRLSAPHYVKIDIEGAEYEALVGAQATLQEYHPMIFLSTHGREIHQTCCDLLVELGYELCPLSGTDVSTTSELIARWPQDSS